MSVNAIQSAADAYSNFSNNTVSPAPATTTPAADSAASGTGVVYEQGKDQVTDSVKKTYTPNTALVDQLKADAKARQEQLMSYVQQMMTGQGNALAESSDVWSFLASGNFTVTEAAKKQAQEAISENGYWGVNQTSDRIIEFAKALSGGDPSKIGELKDAFIKGFGEATKTWKRDLPEISNQTYDAVMKKFDDWANESKKAESNSTASDSAAVTDTATA